MTSFEERRKALTDILEQRVLILDGPWGPCCNGSILRRRISADRRWRTATRTCCTRVRSGFSTSTAPIWRRARTWWRPIPSTPTGFRWRISAWRAGLRAQCAGGETGAPGRRRVLHAGRPRFVAGSMGPTTKSISVVGGVTFPELIEVYYERARGLLDGGVDILLAETCNDTRTVKAALLAIDRLRESEVSAYR